MTDAVFAPGAGWTMPFAAMLLALAVLPLALPRLWTSNRHKLLWAALFGLPVAGLYAIRAPHVLAHAAADYASFIVLLGSLFVVSSGVMVDADLEATPATNTALLASGALLASIVGTTGASMLLIRPMLHTNRQRRHVRHTVVFFIFLVSNVGGLLTPLGDPPLFLGYLAGVPFTWTLRLLPEWLLACALLLGVYWLWDRRMWRQESDEARRLDRTHQRPLRALGRANLVLLGVLVGGAALVSAPWRELLMVAVAALSWRLTPPHVRHANRFTWHPLGEVAAVFAGIFATMPPALALLRAHGATLGVSAPSHFFWATGLLSSMLDNAPTYLAFLALGQGLHLAPDVVGVPHRVLEAIATGAVFMGANTYIGNGPNFMVRAVAEQHGVRMPGFFGYLLFSGAVLLPVWLVVGWVFFG